VEGKWYTLVDALNETLDMWHFGKNKFGYALNNTYLPVKHTILRRPSFTDAYNDDLGFRYGSDTYDGLDIDPTAPNNPLKGYAMAPGAEHLPTSSYNKARKKYMKWRRLSHVRTQYKFSTWIPAPPVQIVNTVRKYFQDK
jgi:hypothetical protein